MGEAAVFVLLFWALAHLLVSVVFNAYLMWRGDPRPPRISVKLEPRDLWLGWYWDRSPLTLYQCIVPGVVLIQRGTEADHAT